MLGIAREGQEGQVMEQGQWDSGLHQAKAWERALLAPGKD